MRARWLGVAVWMLAAGCAHQGESRSPSSEAPLARNTGAVAERDGVRLVVLGERWTGQPQDIERFFHPMEIRLENHSGRPLSLRYEHFVLVGEERVHAIAPGDLPRVASAKSPRIYRNPDMESVRRSSRQAALASRPTPRHEPHDASHVSYTPEILQESFREGPLENGRTRDGFIYFDQRQLAERPVAFQIRLVDAHTGEDFGTLSLPLDAY
jgi:hypothetical protein